MLEKALISGVVHQREETVYRVEGATPARLFGALAEASVNVDTIVQTNAEIVFSAPVEDRADAARDARRARRSVELARRPRQGEPRRRRHEEPPGRRREDLRDARGSRDRAADRHAPRRSRSPATCRRADVDRAVAGPARGVRRLAEPRASASSARPARSGRSRSSCCASAATATCALFASARSAGTELGGIDGRGGDARGARGRRPRPLPLLGRHLRQPRARPPRRRAAARSASTSRPPTGSSRASRSSSPR